MRDGTGLEQPSKQAKGGSFSRHRQLDERVIGGEHGQERAPFNGVILSMERAGVGMVKIART